MSNILQEYDEDFENNIINEEYRIWKKNVPFLYDLVITHELEWPSLTTQWMPIKDINNDYEIHKLILGTHTGGNEPNFLQICKVRLQMDEVEKDEKNQQNISRKSQDNRISIETKIVHEGEVNRARYMPQMPNIIATKTNFGDVLIFDYLKHPTVPDNTEICKPNLRLKGLGDDGYGLKYIASGSYDHQVCIWDINKKNEKDNTIQPLSTYKYHHAAVQDVCWHHFDKNLLASCSDDHSVSLIDINSNSCVNNFIAHGQDVYSCDFSQMNEWLLATASMDNTVGIWDIRNTSKKIINLEGHGDEVVKVEWSPFQMSVLASCGMDRRSIIWDLTKDQADEMPYALFIHAGHKSKISDLSWNINDKLMIASVEDDNILQVWQMQSEIYNEKINEKMEID